MATIGTMTANVTADHRQFTTAMDQAGVSMRKFRDEARGAGEAVGHAGERMGSGFHLSGRQIAMATKESTLGLLLLSNTATGVAGGLARSAAHMAHGFAHGGPLTAGIMGAVSLFALLGEAIHKSSEAEEKALELAEKRRAYNEELRRSVELMEAAKGSAREAELKRQDARARGFEKGGVEGAALEERKLNAEITNQLKEKNAEGVKYVNALRAQRDILAAASDDERKQLELAGKIAEARERAGVHQRAAAEALVRETAALRERAEMEKATAAATKEARQREMQDRQRATDYIVQEHRQLRETLEVIQKQATLRKEMLPYASELVEADRLDLHGLHAEADKLREIVKYRADLATYERITAENKARSERGAAADAATKQRLAIMEATTEEQRRQLKMVDEFNRRVKDGESAALVWKELTVEHGKAVAKEAEEQTRASQAMRDRVELARAETDHARELVRLRQELRDAIHDGNIEAANGLKELMELEKQRAAADEAKKKKDALPSGAGEARERRRKKLHESKDAASAFKRQYDEDGNPVYRDGPIGVISPDKPNGTAFDGLFGGDSKYPGAKKQKGPIRFGPYGPLAPGESAPPDMPTFPTAPPMPTPPQGGGQTVTPPAPPTAELKAGAGSLEAGAKKMEEANKALGDVADKAKEAGGKVESAAGATETAATSVGTMSESVKGYAEKATEVITGMAQKVDAVAKAVDALTRQLAAAGLIGG